METYCDHCYKRRSCRAVYIEELGGFEGWICNKCRDIFTKAGVVVTLLKQYG